jgi:hypothetical protein
MLGIGRRAAIAAGEDLAVVEQSPRDDLGTVRNSGRGGIQRLLFGVDAVIEVLSDAGD